MVSILFSACFVQGPVFLESFGCKKIWSQIDLIHFNVYGLHKWQLVAPICIISTVPTEQIKSKSMTWYQGSIYSQKKKPQLKLHLFSVIFTNKRVYYLIYTPPPLVAPIAPQVLPGNFSKTFCVNVFW